MTAVLVLGLMTATCVQAAAVLATARWPRRAPAAAIVLWQALGLGWGLAAVGTLIGLGTAGQDPGGSAGPARPAGRGRAGLRGGGRRPERAGRLVRGQLGFGPMALARLASLVAGLVLLTLLVWVLLSASAAVLRARQRQRALLSLLAHGDPKVPGALVVDYPAAAAYCLPGLRSAIVISAGTLDLLDSAELAAVLAHERAHLRERHDLVLLPFVALLNGFAWSPVVRKAHQAVALLIEMHADDMARRHRPARELATALLRVGAAGGGLAPSGALAAADPAPDCDVTARVTRLLRPSPGLPGGGAGPGGHGRHPGHRGAGRRAGHALLAPARPAWSPYAILMRSRRKPRPLFSILTTWIFPIWLVVATWVPPSACWSRPTMSMIRTSATSGGTRLVAVRMMSGMAKACSRAAAPGRRSGGRPRPRRCTRPRPRPGTPPAAPAGRSPSGPSAAPCSRRSPARRSRGRPRRTGRAARSGSA